MFLKIAVNNFTCHLRLRPPPPPAPQKTKKHLMHYSANRYDIGESCYRKCVIRIAIKKTNRFCYRKLFHHIKGENCVGDKFTQSFLSLLILILGGFTLLCTLLEVHAELRAIILCCRKEMLFLFCHSSEMCIFELYHFFAGERSVVRGCFQRTSFQGCISGSGDLQRLR